MPSSSRSVMPGANASSIAVSAAPAIADATSRQMISSAVLVRRALAMTGAASTSSAGVTSCGISPPNIGVKPSVPTLRASRRLLLVIRDGVGAGDPGPAVVGGVTLPGDSGVDPDDVALAEEPVGGDGRVGQVTVQGPGPEL